MQIAAVRIAQEADIAHVRQVADEIAATLGLESFARTRAVTACLEIARNALQYAGGGRAAFRGFSERGRSFLSISVSDQGSGIENSENVLSGRAVYGGGGGGLGGKGMGLGLRGVRRLADRFDLKTGAEGTKVEIAFEIPVPATRLPDAVKAAADALLALKKTDPAVELARQNRELSEALAERELLINEVHHRTGNNLALILGFIQMSRRNAQSEETRQALLELEARVHSVAAVHKDLHRANKVDRIDIVPFLRSVADHAAEAFSKPGTDIDIVVEGDSVYTTSSAAIDLGLIAGELITNAFKHAFKGRASGRIDIGFNRVEQDREEAAEETASAAGYCLVVADDGPGLDEGDVRPERAESLGWRMIRAMAARHDGNIETSSDDGFRVAIRFAPEIVSAG